MLHYPAKDKGSSHAGDRGRQPQRRVGKSTLSSNIAGYFARKGPVMLGDIDRQQSLAQLAGASVRADMPRILSWEIDA